MAVRPIDGTWSKFVWNLSESESLARKFRDGKACLIDLRLAVEAQPTITPPNELMEALEAINNAAVAYIEGGPYENDLPGLELALEIDRLSRDFVRPPKGEEET